MKTRLTRRSALRVLAGSAAAGSLLVGHRAPAAPAAEVRELAIISKQPGKYHGWPTIARRKNGQLLVSCSGGREAHVCPSAAELITSDDRGAGRSPRPHGYADRRPRRASGNRQGVDPRPRSPRWLTCDAERARKIAAGQKGAICRQNGSLLAVHNQLDEAQRKARGGLDASLDRRRKDIRASHTARS